MKPLPRDTTSNVLALLDTRLSIPQIHSRTGVSIGAIHNLAKEHRPNRPYARRGRPPILNDHDIRQAIHWITTGEMDTAVQVAKALEKIKGQPVSADVVRRTLRNAGLVSVKKQKKPRLVPRHVKARYDFALEHKDWTVADWGNVTFTDETKINLYGSDGLKWAWKKLGEPLTERIVNPTVKFGGGSIMIWGCMFWEGVGTMEHIAGRMTAERYVAILDGSYQQALEKYNKEAKEVIFQQDNDPKHTSKLARKWFKDHGINLLSWPAQSPDLNPIEHLWFHVKCRLAEYKTPPSGQIELKQRIEQVWSEIPAGVCQNLIKSMPSRVDAVIKAKGGYTKY
jgi:transposase